jgi:hypothetical protein
MGDSAGLVADNYGLEIRAKLDERCPMARRKRRNPLRKTKAALPKVAGANDNLVVFRR